MTAIPVWRTPAQHRRMVRLERDAGRLVITDTVGPSGEWPCRLAFHLGPGVICELSDDVAELAWQAGDRACSASLTLPPALAWSATKGATDPPLGWYSPRFGEKVPATALIGTGRIAAGSFLITELRFHRSTMQGGGAC